MVLSDNTYKNKRSLTTDVKNSKFQSIIPIPWPVDKPTKSDSFEPMKKIGVREKCEQTGEYHSLTKTKEIKTNSLKVKLYESKPVLAETIKKVTFKIGGDVRYRENTLYVK
jgi:predicted metalloenzyme YecM